ncbi:MULTISPECIES: hypothetical protein [Psychrobacter]|uniref:hypothetical protein n=1 Tax=Psychrobacter TaxID=497 RepID=UPI00146ACC14|nr:MULTISPECIES: hypothetical protein [Psychrobacter]
MEPSATIGSSIFMYIAAFVLVLAVFAYLTYRISPSRKKRLEEKRNIHDRDTDSRV